MAAPSVIVMVTNEQITARVTAFCGVATAVNMVVEMSGTAVAWWQVGTMSG